MHLLTVERPQLDGEERLECLNRVEKRSRAAQTFLMEQPVELPFGNPASLIGMTRRLVSTDLLGLENMPNTAIFLGIDLDKPKALTVVRFSFMDIEGTRIPFTLAGWLTTTGAISSIAVGSYSTELPISLKGSWTGISSRPVFGNEGRIVASSPYDDYFPSDKNLKGFEDHSKIIDQMLLLCDEAKKDQRAKDVNVRSHPLFIGSRPNAR